MPACCLYPPGNRFHGNRCGVRGRLKIFGWMPRSNDRWDEDCETIISLSLKEHNHTHKTSLCCGSILSDWISTELNKDRFAGQFELVFEFSVIAQRQKLHLTAAGNRQTRRDCPEPLTGGETLWTVKSQRQCWFVKAMAYGSFFYTGKKEKIWFIKYWTEKIRLEPTLCPSQSLHSPNTVHAAKNTGHIQELNM